jgi:hypothetical protein
LKQKKVLRPSKFLTKEFNMFLCIVGVCVVAVVLRLFENILR